GFMAAAWGGARCGFLLADPATGRRFLEEEIGKARQLGAPLRRRALQSDLSCACALAGDLKRAAQLLQEIGDEVLDQEAAAYAKPLVAFYAGDLLFAEELWLQAVGHHAKGGNRWSETTFDLWLGALYRLRGDEKAAAQRLESALAIAIDGPSLPLTIWASAALALLYTEIGELPKARIERDRCLDVVANGEDWRGLAGRARLAEAVVAAAEGPLAEAEPLFDGAIAVFQQYTLAWDEAEALLFWGRALARNRRRSAAREKFAAALEIYNRCGAGGVWQERVETEIHRLDSGRTLPESRHPNDLSEREVEVLRF